MPHPSIEAIVRGDSAARTHAETCDACRSLAGMVEIPGAPADDPAAVLRELPTIDRALYGEFRPLDAGGMGQMSSARDRRLGRRVAIKELRADAPDRAALARRLEREARLTARLQHPSIVGVYEAGRWGDGETFYAMPLVRGRPLDSEIAARPAMIDRLRLVPHVIAACEALAYAHGEGVVHRDLKPANVMVGEYGETVVIDWGLAKARDEGTADEPAGAPVTGALTALGIGTPQYMPPEQARGEEPDARTDVYALGATLYHVLAGAPPYGTGDSATVRRRLLAGPPAALRTAARDAPPELIAIVDKAMAREPALRFASARELAAELERFGAGQLTLTHHYTLGELARRFARRHRAALAIAAAAAIALAAIGLVATRRVIVERDRATAGDRAALAALAESQAARASLLAATPTTRLDAVATALAAAAPALRAGEPVPPEVARGLFDAVTSGPMLVPLAGAATIARAAFSPTGDRFATIDGERTVRVWDARRGTELARRDSALPHAYWATWSPDGTQLAITGLSAEVELWRVGGEAQRIATAGSTEHARFFADGTLAIATRDGALALWRDGARVAEITVPCTVAEAEATSNSMWVACSDGGIYGWRGAAPIRLAQLGAAVTGLALAPDGATLFAGTSDGRALAFTLADPSAAPREVWHEPGRRVYALQATAAWLAIAVGTTIILADGKPVEDDEIAIAAAPPLFGAAPRVFATTYRGLAVLAIDVGSHAVVARLHGHRSADDAHAIGSPDGERVLSVAGGGEAWLWDARFGVVAGTLPAHDGEVVALAAGAEHALTLAAGGLARTVGLRDGAIARAVPGAAIASAATAGERAIAGGADGTVRTWRAGAPARTHAIGQAPVSAVALAADGSIAAAGDVDGTVASWAPESESPAEDWHAERDPVTAIAAGPGWIASGHRSGAVRIWIRGEPAPRAIVRGAEVSDLLASPDAAQLAIGRGGTGEVLDTRDWHTIGPLAGRPLAWSAQGALALTDGAGGLRLHSSSGDRTLGGHDRAITAAAFTHDGAQLWTGDTGGALRAWTVVSIDPAAAITLVAREPDAITALAPTTDDRFILAGASSGVIRVEPTSLDAARERACSLLGFFGRDRELSDLCPPPAARSSDRPAPPASAAPAHP